MLPVINVPWQVPATVVELVVFVVGLVLTYIGSKQGQDHPVSLGTALALASLAAGILTMIVSMPS